MGALFDFKCTCDSTLVYVCQAEAEKCIFVWTILSQTPRRTPPGNVRRRSDFSPDFLTVFLKERRMLRKRDYQGRLSFHFFDRWMTYLATHRQKKVQPMSWKNLQMLSWMGPINCAPNPTAGPEVSHFSWTKVSSINVWSNCRYCRWWSNSLSICWILIWVQSISKQQRSQLARKEFILIVDEELSETLIGNRALCTQMLNFLSLGKIDFVPVIVAMVSAMNVWYYKMYFRCRAFFAC